MSSLGYTPSEPLRDDEPPEPHPFDMVRCDRCTLGTRTIERRGRLIKRKCRECGGTGTRLRGNPPDSAHCLTLDFTGGTA